jgi:hypothetical protein
VALGRFIPETGCSPTKARGRPSTSWTHDEWNITSRRLICATWIVIFSVANGPSRKVLAVGDSYTFGWLVRDRVIYVRLIEDYVNVARPGGSPRFHFLDAAVGGWSAGAYTVYLRDFLPHFQPETYWSSSTLTTSAER